MKKWISFRALAPVLTIILSGCSLAPVQNYHSAQSLGAGKNELKLSGSVPGVSYDRGLTSNLDVGVGAELQSAFLLNLRTKYSFVNQKNGMSFAGLAGFGYSDDLGESRSAYLGPIVSFRRSDLEIFLGYRLNAVHMDGKLSFEDRDDMMDFIPLKANFMYSQIDLGMTFYGENMFTTLGLRTFITSEDQAFLPIVDVGLRF